MSLLLIALPTFEPRSLPKELVLLRLSIRLTRMLWPSTSLKMDKCVDLTKIFQIRALAFFAMLISTSPMFIKVASGSIEGMLSCIQTIGYQPF